MNRIHDAEQTVRSRVGDRALTQDQFDSFVSAVFNLGAAGAAAVLQQANRADDPAVVRALNERVRSTPRDRDGRATGPAIVLPGLVRRRAQEAPVPAPNGTRSMISRLRLAAAAAFAFGCPTVALAAPTVADFQGQWTISHVLGSSPGGVTAEKPSVMIGRSVEWTSTSVRLPGKACMLHDAAVRDEPNEKLGDSIWGGQKIGGLALSRGDAGRAFGTTRTPVFEDRDGCSYAVSIDHDRLIVAFPSGYIYLLQRSERHR